MSALPLERILAKARHNPIFELLETKSYSKVPRCLSKTLSLSGLSKTAIDLYKTLYDLCLSKDGDRETLTCEYSREFLAELIGRKSTLTVTRLVKELESKGYLQVSRSRLSKKRCSVNSYTLFIPEQAMDFCKAQPNRRNASNDLFKKRLSNISDTVDTRNISNNKQYNNKNIDLLDINKDCSVSVFEQDESKPEGVCLSVVERIETKHTKQGGFRMSDARHEVGYNCRKIFNRQDLSEASDQIHPVIARTGSKEISPSLILEPAIKLARAIPEDAKQIRLELRESIFKQIKEHERISCQKAGEMFDCNSIINQEQNSSSPNLERIVQENVKLKLIARENNEIHDRLRNLNILAKNNLGLTCIAWLAVQVKRYNDFQSQYHSLNAANASQERLDAYFSYLDTLKTNIERDRVEVKKSMLIASPYFVGHDLEIEQPRIPKNVLLNYYSKVVSIIGERHAIGVINEISASVRFGELSRCVDEKGIQSNAKGFNVALKLLNEGRWVTPDCIEQLEKHIEAMKVSFVYKGYDLFGDLSLERQLFKTTDACASDAFDEFVKDFKADWFKSLSGEEEEKINQETGQQGFCAKMTYFSKCILPSLKDRFSMETLKA